MPACLSAVMISIRVVTPV